MKFIKLYCWVSLMLSTSLLVAQKYSIEDLPLELLKDAKEIVRKDETKITVKNISGYKISSTTAYTILNRKSRRNVEALYYDSNSKVDAFRAFVYDKNGKLVRKSKKKEIKDYSDYDGFSVFSDNRVKVLSLSHIEYPYTIEFQSEMTYEETFSYPNWYILPGFNTAVQSTSYEITLKGGTDIYFKNQNTQIEPEIKEGSDTKIYRWEAKNIPAIKYELGAPTHIFSVVRISPQQFSMSKLEGSMKDWESFGNFIYRLNEGRSELSPAMKTKVQTLIADAPDEKTKINRLYRYIQKNMRYVSVQLGVGGYQTFSAKYVEKNKYGDCKALTFFMRALLKEAGIEAHPALIYSGDSSPVLENSFTESAFNHIILNVPSQACWLECTSSTMPTGYFGSNNTNRKALLIKESGSTLVDMPKIENNLKKNKISIQLAANGSAEISNSIEAHGMAHESYRGRIHHQSQEEMQKQLQKRLSIASFSFKDFDISAEKEAPKAALSYTLEVPKYASRGGKRLFVPLNPINKFSFRPKAMKNRKLPIHGNDTYQLQSTVELLIPAGYKVESIPSKAIKMDSPFGKYELTVEQKEGKILLTRIFNEVPFEAPAEKYKDYRAFYNKIAKADKVKAVLVKAE